ncbi:MAG: Coenzyme A biosynthesis bifunctional protein CoaBC [Hyphomicrobiaceae bacterium hypho_1]
MQKQRIILIIGGSIAAYKCLELIRQLRERDISVLTIITKAAQHFVTPLSVAALSNNRVFTNLFDVDEESEIGHIRLSRKSSLIVVAPATADLLAKMAGGHADDLATAVLMAADKPVLAIPAMNPRMWKHPATQRNVSQLLSDGVQFLGPNFGKMAEANEAGPGRMSEPTEIVEVIEFLLADRTPMKGYHVLITAGPTYEPIDPVRYIANRSSGKQGYALAIAARNMGAKVTLVSGPTNLNTPHGVKFCPVVTVEEMLSAVEASLPADVAIFAAAAADWRISERSTQKIKKNGNLPPLFSLSENPDILRIISGHEKARPKLVVGFAAETENVIENAKAKLFRKKCDLIIANDVSHYSGIMRGMRNEVHIVSYNGVESWPEMDKQHVANKLLKLISEQL